MDFSSTSRDQDSATPPESGFEIHKIEPGSVQYVADVLSLRSFIEHIECHTHSILDCRELIENREDYFEDEESMNKKVEEDDADYFAAVEAFEDIAGKFKCNWVRSHKHEIFEERMAEFPHPFADSSSLAPLPSAANSEPEEAKTDTETTGQQESAPNAFAVAETLKSWRQRARPSPFGNSLTGATEFNDEVRRAKEFPAKEIFDGDDPETRKKIELMCNTIAWYWRKDMFPTRVRVEPYKLNLYGAGDHFAEHRDTPDVNLVGTAVLCIAETVHSPHLEEIERKRLEVEKEIEELHRERDAIHEEIKKLRTYKFKGDVEIFNNGEEEKKVGELRNQYDALEKRVQEASEKRFVFEDRKKNLDLYDAPAECIRNRDTAQRNAAIQKHRQGNKDLRVGNSFYRLKRGSLVLMYTDTPHSVPPIREASDPSLPEPMRATLTFKIWAVGGTESGSQKAISDYCAEDFQGGGVDVKLRTAMFVKEELKNLFLSLNRPIAFLLGHQYSRQTNCEFALKGFDGLLYEGCAEAMRLKGTGHRLRALLPMPVVCTYEETTSAQGDIEHQDSKIYPILELDLCRHLRKQPSAEAVAFHSAVERFRTDYYKKRRKIQVVRPCSSDGFHEWSSVKHESATYTGNEGRGGDENSVYLDFLLLVDVFPSKEKRALANESDQEDASEAKASRTESETESVEEASLEEETSLSRESSSID